MNIFKKLIALGTLACTFAACSGPIGNDTGHEYMPDMAHSVAVEANTYNNYWANSFDKQSVISRIRTSMPGLPVNGTIPRGYAGIALSGDHQQAMLALLNGESSPNDIRTPMNGNVPYYYGDTEEDRARAIKDITSNPFPITKRGLEYGKDLYVIYCGICHGDKGDGSGYLVRDDGGKYPAQPANLINDDFINSSEGRFYHAIMHGKNAMGAYSDKLSYEERWDVIHYIRSLQAGVKNLTYNENTNNFNKSIPGNTIVKIVEKPATIQAAVIPAAEKLVNETENKESH